MTADTASEPRQPSRFEKNRNTRRLYPEGSCGVLWRVVRLVVVAVIAVCGFLPVLLLVTLYIGGTRFGLVPCAVLGLVFGTTTGLVAVPTEWPRSRRVATSVLAGLGAVAGAGVALLMPVNEAQLRMQLVTMVDHDWRFVEETTSGNALCFDYCTSVSWELEADGTPEEVLDAMATTLETHGLERPRVMNGSAWTSERDGAVFLSLDVSEAEGDRTTVVLTAEAG